MNTMIYIVVILTLHTILQPSLASTSQRKLLQRHVQPIIGPSGLSCAPQIDDNLPDNCIPPGGQTLTGSPDIECNENFDCCLCKSMICGSPDIPCQKMSCNGDYGCIGVQDISIVGSGDAEINCNGDYSCNTVWITGQGIKQVICNGDHSCAQSRFDLVCNIKDPCAIQCSGENSCEGAPQSECHQTTPPTCTVFRVKNTAGLSCSNNACSNGVFILENNSGGNILCNGETSCQNTEIVTNDVALVICGQAAACKNAEITITNPRQDFSLQCTAPGSCEGMILTLIINDPAVEMLKGLVCSAPTACRGLIVEITRSYASNRNIFIEKLECNGLNACQNARFLLDEDVTFQNCECGTSSDRACDGIAGVDTCLSGLDKLECVSDACHHITETIHNPENGFELICGGKRSCELFHLNLNIDDFGSQPISYLNGYTCSDEQSCKDAVIILNNQQRNEWVDIEWIACTGESSCLNTQFIMNGNVKTSDILCADHACIGCTVTINGVCGDCMDIKNNYDCQKKCKKGKCD